MNPFYSRFRKKTEKELQFILENEADYTQEAIEAARHLLKLEEFRKEEVLQDQLAEQKRRSKRRRKNTLSGDEQIKLYLKGFTRGQFFTLLTLTLFYWALFEVFNLYSNERGFETILYPGLIIFIPITFILNHVFYRIEVKENTYWGRVVSTIFLLSFMILFRMCYQTFIDGDYRYEFNLFGFFGIILALVLLAVIFELLVSLINELLKAIKWPHL